MSTKIDYIGNDGSGFSGPIDIADGTSVMAFFAQKYPGKDPANYRIRLNRAPADRNHLLKTGDMLSIAPTKLEGANY